MPAIDIAQLAIYAMLSIPVVYCLVKHGRTGFLGWFYLLGFCGLRLAAAGMENSNKNNSSNSQGTLIVENIGLTPLLLGSIGVLHEAYVDNPFLIISNLKSESRTNHPSLNRRVTSKLTRQPKVEWIGILFYHILVSSAVALMVVGITNLTSTTNGQPSSRSSSSGLLKGGFVVIFLCWVLLTVFALWSWSTARRSRASSVPYALDREQEAQPTFDERGKSRATQDRDGSSLVSQLCTRKGHCIWRQAPA